MLKPKSLLLILFMNALLDVPKMKSRMDGQRF